MIKRHPELILSILILVLALVACENTTTPGPGMPLVYSQPLLVDNQEKAYAAAQATLTAGLNEIADISHQATLVRVDSEHTVTATYPSYLQNRMGLS